MSKPWHAVHKALADPTRIRLLEALWAKPASARELADYAGMPADRLYYHLGRLEQAGLIRVAEYRPLARGKVERVYVPVDVEPPGDADPEETAAFLGSVLDATSLDITAAYRARQAGRRREVAVHRVGVRLTDEALAELLGHIERLVRPSAQETEGGAEAEPAGSWVRLLVAVVDLEDRPEPEPDASSRESASSESEPP
jgi:DNA-binding transcriptional ArsR family regulator